MPRGFMARSWSGVMEGETRSEKTPASRTRRAMSWAVCPPKSRIGMTSRVEDAAGVVIVVLRIRGRLGPIGGSGDGSGDGPWEVWGEISRAGSGSDRIGGVRSPTGVQVLAGVVLPILAAGGCAPEAASFDSREPGARLEASFKAVESRDGASTDELIRMLQSDDPAERLVAIRSLERLTGQTLGYDHAGPEAEREAAVERWVAWWKASHSSASQTGPLQTSESRAGHPAEAAAATTR